MRSGSAIFLIAIALLLLYIGISNKYLCLSTFAGCLFTPNPEIPNQTGTSGGSISLGPGTVGFNTGGPGGGIGGVINIPIPGLPGGIPAPFGPFDGGLFDGQGGFSAANVTQAKRGR